jgi:putative peptide zinc metalloprotease protein
MEPDNYNESTDLANLQLKLRAGLDFELREHGQTRCYVVHDETSSNYFQIGVPEYAFLSVLDGKTNLQEAIEATAHQLKDDALTIRDAVRISHWLLESGLANAVDQSGNVLTGSEHLIDQADSRSRQKVVSQSNPMFIRLPLGNPSAFIKFIAPLFGWICSIPFLAVWIGVVAFAIIRVFQQPEVLVSSAQGLLTANAWAWMLATLVGLKVVHELAHGLFCNRFGGSVKETGIVFILFIPMPYVDVTSCWSFASRWKRIAVAAAGMYVEVFIAALAAIAWSLSHDPVLKFHLFNVMLLGSLTTVLFNANFLMRFDGYYMLSDLLEIPNLYQKGQQFVNGLGRRFILGINASSSAEPLQRSVVIRVYGFAALVWRILICVSLTILASAMFYGFGLVFAIIGVVLWLGLPLWRFTSQWKDPSVASKPNFKWISMVTTPVATALILGMTFLPWPIQVSAPAIVEYKAPAMVRADAAGFVKGIHVSAGQNVMPGVLLIELENRDLETRLVELQLERKKSLIRSRSFHQNREVAAYQSENASRQSIEEQIDELQQELASLKLFSNAEGIVVASDLATLHGQFISPGESVMQIVDEKSKSISISVSQDHFDSFKSHQTNGVAFVPRHGLRRVAGILNSVQPTATSIADVRLTSHVGGSLPVRQRSGPNQNRDQSEDDSLELVFSRFVGEVEVNKSDASVLRAGTVGSVQLDRYDETIGEHIVVATRRWISKMLEATRR